MQKSLHTALSMVLTRGASHLGDRGSSASRWFLEIEKFGMGVTPTSSQQLCPESVLCVCNLQQRAYARFIILSASNTTAVRAASPFFGPFQGSLNVGIATGKVVIWGKV